MFRLRIAQNYVQFMCLGLVVMDVKRFFCHPVVFLPFILSSVPASEEIGSVGDCGPAGSGSGGAEYRSDLCHSHRQCACCWILPRHHRE